jgi:hypothetical protein
MKMIFENENKFSLLDFESSDSLSWDPLDCLVLDEPERLKVDKFDLLSIFDHALTVLDDMSVPVTFGETHGVFGMEVGDDRTDASRSTISLALGLVCQEQVLHMQTSDEDTCISNTVWNFCEISNGIPADVSQTFDYCRKNNNFDELGFVDSPPLRIILDVSKGDGSHSSTASGKAAMLASRMRTPRTSTLRVLQLASFMQDGMLRTNMSSDPKYLPRIMGGSGARPLFDNAENLYLYTLAYKSGRCNRVYGSATRELHTCLSELSRSRATMPVLCRMLSDKQEYLHGTYAGMIFAPKYSYKDVQLETLPPPLIESTGGANRFNATLNRLVRTKHLVTRSSALREWEYSKTIRSRLLSRLPTERFESEDVARKQHLKRAFGSALCANTAFANLLARDATWKDVQTLMGSDKHITLTSGTPEFTYYDAQWLASGGKYENFSIEDLTITEDLHSREDVSEEQTFKVGGLQLRPIVGDTIKAIRTTTKIGLYEINTSMHEWAELLYRRLLEHREGEKPLPRDVVLTEIMKDPEWVNDDTGLIEMCLQLTKTLHQRSARVVLVSMDKRLANQMSNTCNVQVERLHPISYIMKMREFGLDPINDRASAKTIIGRLVPSRERNDPVREVYVDTGSVAHVLSNLEEYGQGESTHVMRREHLSTGVGKDGHRWTKYVLREIPRAALSLNTVPIRPVLRDRRFPHRQSLGASSRRGSWRTTSTNSVGE